MSWSNKYIGIPFLDLGRSAAGVDCYGLLCLVYRQELGIILPSYTGAYACADEQAEVAGLIEGARQTGPWLDRGGAFHQPFDVLLFRQGRFATHLGIVVYRNQMLHTSGEEHALIETIDQSRWVSRLLGIYHHPAAQ